MIQYFKVIVREPDGNERLVMATNEQQVVDSIVLWDSRIQGDVPLDLLKKANAEDLKRKAAQESVEQTKKQSKLDALNRLLLSNDKDIQDLLILLGHK